MILLLVGYLPGTSGFLALMMALALSMGGGALLIYVTRSTGNDLARRVRLVQPIDHSGARAAEKAAANAVLTRSPFESGEGPNRSELVRRLGKWGVAPNNAMTAYLGIRLGFVFLLAGFLYLALPYFAAFAASRALTALLAAGGGIGGWFIPAIFVHRFVKQHVTMVASGLPDALELLVICVEAGLSLEDSLVRIVKEMKDSHSALAAELMITSADLRILPNRDQAFANLASRVNVPSIRSVVTTLSQTMRFGTPLAQALRVVASEMRNDSLVAMEGRANRLPALLTVPMMLFIMPTIFLIVGGPAALRVADTLLK